MQNTRSPQIVRRPCSETVAARQLCLHVHPGGCWTRGGQRAMLTRRPKGNA